MVTPPAQSPSTRTTPGLQLTLTAVELPERSSSLRATASPLEPDLPASVEVDHRFLGPHYAPPLSSSSSLAPPSSCPTPVPPPIPPRNSPWHNLTATNRQSAAQAPPNARRRAAHTWDRNFMPSIAQPAAQQPITNPSRERIVRKYGDDIGRAL
ncbi:unnamed protein product [Cutaneotrichosporon oleaginosum]